MKLHFRSVVLAVIVILTAFESISGQETDLTTELWDETSRTTELWEETTELPTTKNATEGTSTSRSSTSTSSGTTEETTIEDECHDNEGIYVDCPATDPELPVYLPYPYDCTKFIECTNGEPEVHCCAPGTVWDQSLEICNHNASTPCVIVPTVPTTPTTTTTTTTTTTRPTTTTTTPTTTTTTTTTTPEPTSDDPSNWICPPEYLGPIAHPYTCEQFYSCDPGNRPCLYDCNDGLYFDPISLNCEWPENIQAGLCDGGTPPPYTPWTTTGRPRTTPAYSGSYRTAQRSYMESSPLKAVLRQGPCENPVTVFY